MDTTVKSPYILCDLFSIFFILFPLLKFPDNRALGDLHGVIKNSVLFSHYNVFDIS